MSPLAPNDVPPLKHDPYAAFRSRNYRYFVGGFSLGTIGMQMQTVAVGWEIYSWTHSKLALGWIGLAMALPTIVLALPAGHWADRFDRKKITCISLLLTSLCALMIGVLSVLTNRGQFSVHTAQWVMYGLLVLEGSAACIGRPARAALLPQIVKPSVFPNAVTWNSSVFELSSMLGPAIGGLIVYRFSPATAYFSNAVLALVYGAFLLMLRVERRPQALRRAAGLKDLLAGIEFMFATKLLLGVVTLDMFAVLLGGATFLLPVFAKDILGGTELEYGFLRAAPSIGAFTMAFVIAHLPPFKRAGRVMLLAVAGFGLVTIVFGLSRSFPLSFAMLVLTGAFDNVSVVVRHTLIQVLTPDSMRGRVSAVNQVFIGSSNELGGLESGVTAEWWGPVASVVFGGIGTVLVVIGCAAIFPPIRAVGRLTDVQPPDDPPASPELNNLKLIEEAAREGTD